MTVTATGSASGAESVFSSLWRKTFLAPSWLKIKGLSFLPLIQKPFQFFLIKKGIFFYPKNNNTHFVALYMYIKIVHPLIKL